MSAELACMLKAALAAGFKASSARSDSPPLGPPEHMRTRGLVLIIFWQISKFHSNKGVGGGK